MRPAIHVCDADVRLYTVRHESKPRRMPQIMSNKTFGSEQVGVKLPVPGSASAIKHRAVDTDKQLFCSVRKPIASNTMAPRQRHMTQPSLQDDITTSLAGTSGAPVTAIMDDDDDDNDTMNDDDKRMSKPLLIVGTKHGASLVETTTPVYPNDEPAANNINTAELSRDRHDLFNIVALVSFLRRMLVLCICRM